jgi:hypothetical protein
VSKVLRQKEKFLNSNDDCQSLPIAKPKAIHVVDSSTTITPEMANGSSPVSSDSDELASGGSSFSPLQSGTFPDFTAELGTRLRSDGHGDGTSHSDLVTNVHFVGSFSHPR